MNKKNQTTKPVQQEPQPPYHEDEDDFFIDESLVNLFKILLPKLTMIAIVSTVMALIIGCYIYLSPRQYECVAVVTPDVMKDLTSFDIASMTSGDSDMAQIPYASQLSQLQTLAKSSQVKKAILNELELYQRWDCDTIRDCIINLNAMYNVREIRNVGLELSATHVDEQLVEDVVQSAIQNTNQFFEDLMKSKAKNSIDQISTWINDVTQEIQQVSNEFIDFASANNISNLQTQFNSGSALVATLKENITIKESELAEKLERFGPQSHEIIPLKASITNLRNSLKQILYGEENQDSQESDNTFMVETLQFNQDANVYPPLAQYEQLKIKVQDYENQLAMLRNQADLFSKNLASAQIESQRQARSIMMLDEPYVAPVGKGTVKFTILTFIGMFFFLCIAVIMYEYFTKLFAMIKEKE